MRIYTRTGDKGSTSLFGGTRVSKADIRIETYGTVDELNAYLGLIRSQDINTVHEKELHNIQTTLFTIGSELALDPKKATLKNGKERLPISKINKRHITFLEKAIDQMNDTLPPLKNFILPGGHTTIAHCHVARTICRRAERRVAALLEAEPVNEFLIQYLNRLSDYLFVLARSLAEKLDVKETPWQPEKKTNG